MYVCSVAVNIEKYRIVSNELNTKNVTLVAVSKLQPVSHIQALYDAGHRDFGENYVQELVDKQAKLPSDIRWHFIGHLQSNKVKYIASFVHLIQGVDSYSLLKEINKQAAKHDRIIPVLLQVHIAEEETKFGLNAAELEELLQQLSNNLLPHIQVKGLMGMASFSDDKEKIRKEFRSLHQLFATYKEKGFTILSMGMSGDFTVAIEEGSTLVRIGSLLFGARV